MEVQIRGVHYTISNTLMENIEKKITRLDYVKDHIVHFYFTIVKDSKDYKIEADIIPFLNAIYFFVFVSFAK